MAKIGHLNLNLWHPFKVCRKSKNMLNNSVMVGVLPRKNRMHHLNNAKNCQRNGKQNVWGGGGTLARSWRNAIFHHVYLRFNVRDNKSLRKWNSFRISIDFQQWKYAAVILWFRHSARFHCLMNVRWISFEFLKMSQVIYEAKLQWKMWNKCEKCEAAGSCK